MGFQHGLSGLSVASQNLDVIGNNIANANTVGFKQSHAQFSDLYANSLTGASGDNTGIGAKVASVAQQFSQGTITATSNPLDIAINGNGFFRMSDNGAISYSRNGQFHVDANGFVVNNNNLNLTGYTTDANGNILAADPTNLRISTAALSPNPTLNFSTGLNLDSRVAVPAPLPAFNATDPSTYTGTTSGTIFDSLGNAHIFSIYFQKNAANTWDMYATVDGATTPAGVPVGVTLGGGPSQAVTFDSNGNLTAPAAPITVSVDLATINPTLGATSPLDFSLDLTGTTQFGTDFSVNTLNQDGYSSGTLAGFSIDGEGFLSGNYTNGESRTLGQVVLANFSNPHGLTPIGNNQWVESKASGQPLVGAPGSGTMGILQSSAVEDSNVDLTTELVHMITTQRTYQANAKTIETQDAILQTLVNL
ncbi:flagellar hook protein FlgE [Nitrosomonas sp.]|uniref:flagellar hook protein FlgE n=1 Tax=Nitrosomonas sp. TaxID=42353 RepID=UPI001DDF9E9E|nr:flagellar hook protein FlgE [Nitrosomonas sp.]MCB1947546.1 flagellar hook protein FlgE [Nitrosomonas sp.]MCP5244209.1 flagellar hook protein FlgE [Burkholderiales bacterium]MDR4515261.1 flagellar hook protein FlgE [Nitrosomonas sp.]